MNFYGPEKVIKNEGEGEFLKLTLERESGEIYQTEIPKSVFEEGATEEKSDWNHVQEIKFSSLTKEVLEMMMERGITGGEFKPFLQTLTYAYYNVLDRAISYQFTGDDSRFVPGGSDIHFDFTLNRAHEITKHLDEPKNTTTDTSA